MFKGDIEVKYGGITVDETPQKYPNINLVKYMTCRSKDTACAITATTIITSTRIIVFFYPIELTNLLHDKDPT